MSCVRPLLFAGLLSLVSLAVLAPACSAPGQEVRPDTASDFAFIEVLLQG